jgi:hypothetical protein
MAFNVNRHVDHHNRVLCHDTNKENHTKERHDAEFGIERSSIFSTFLVIAPRDSPARGGPNPPSARSQIRGMARCEMLTSNWRVQGDHRQTARDLPLQVTDFLRLFDAAVLAICAGLGLAEF